MGHPEITHFVGVVQQIPNASCPPPSLYSGSCSFCCYDNEMGSITMTKLVHVEERIYVNSRSFAYFCMASRSSTLSEMETFHSNLITVKQIFFCFHLGSNCLINKYLMLIVIRALCARTVFCLCRKETVFTVMICLETAGAHRPLAS